METIFNNIQDVNDLLDPSGNNKYGLIQSGNTWLPTKSVKLFSTGSIKTIDDVYINGDITMSDYAYDTH